MWKAFWWKLFVIHRQYITSYGLGRMCAGIEISTEWKSESVCDLGINHPTHLTRVEMLLYQKYCFQRCWQQKWDNFPTVMQMVACLSEEIWGQLQEESAPCLIVTTGFCTPCGAAATLDAAVESRSWLGRLNNRIGHMLFQLLARSRQKCEASIGWFWPNIIFVQKDNCRYWPSMIWCFATDLMSLR